jgi:hypothetical protein
MLRELNFIHHLTHDEVFHLQFLACVWNMRLKASPFCNQRM